MGLRKAPMTAQPNQHRTLLPQVTFKLSNQLCWLLPLAIYHYWKCMDTVIYLQSALVLDFLILSEEVPSHCPQNLQGLNLGLAFISLFRTGLTIQPGVVGHCY